MKFLSRLGARLRAAYFAFLARPSGTSNALTEPVADDGAVPWGKIHSMLQGTPLSLEDFNPTRGGRLEYKMPDVLPGVRPAKMPPKEVVEGDGGVVLAMDGGYEEKLATDDGIGTPSSWGFAGAIGPGLAFLGFPYLAELEQITEYRTPAESLSTEMTRKWGKIVVRGKTGKDLDDKIADITQCMEDMKIREHFRRAAYLTESFGRSHLYVSIKGQDDDRPRQLPLTAIKQGSLQGFSIIEPYWVTPYSWNATHPERPDFYKPSSWFVLGRKTHSTRLLTFIFREVPDLLKPAYSFAGISITQLMMPYVNRWLRTAKSVNDLINIFSIVTLSTDLATLLQNDQNGKSQQGLIARIKGFVASRDNKGMLLINKSSEELAVNDVSLGSLDKLQAQAQEHMATPARMTLLKFFGITPTGLNASAEPERESWNDYVHAMQELGYTPHMKVVLDLIQMHLYGVVEKELAWEWLSLFEPTGKEKAEIRAADANRDAAYIEKNVVSPDEVRDRLRMDPESGYDGLEGDAPEPQEWNGGPDDPEVDTDKDDKPPSKEKDK